MSKMIEDFPPSKEVRHDSDSWPSYKPAFGEWCGPWVSYFAWFPTMLTDGSIAWLRTIRRRRVIKHWYLHSGPNCWYLYDNF